MTIVNTSAWKATTLIAMAPSLYWKMLPSGLISSSHCLWGVYGVCCVTQIIFAREFLKEVRMKPDQVKYLVTNARNGMCQGHRAELFAVKAAQACAALAVSPLFPPCPLNIQQPRLDSSAVPSCTDGPLHSPGLQSLLMSGAQAHSRMQSAAAFTTGLTA